jgi:lysozyme family protein
MSIVRIATDFVLRQEDGRMTGAVTTIPGDRGGPTRFGIASRFHPELVAQGFFDTTRVGYGPALVIAESVYNTSYAKPLLIAGITDQALATAVLSFGINSGIVKPVKFLQLACSQLGHMLAADGQMGPQTLAIVNQENPDTLLAGFSNLARRFYVALATNPRNAPNLKGWLNRANAWQANAAQLRAAVAST